MSVPAYREQIRRIGWGATESLTCEDLDGLIEEARSHDDLEAELELCTSGQIRDEYLERLIQSLSRNSQVEAALHYLLKQPPFDDVWHALFQIAEAFPERTNEIEVGLSGWPATSRPMPHTWLARLRRGERQPYFRLVRSLCVPQESEEPQVEFKGIKVAGLSFKQLNRNAPEAIEPWLSDCLEWLEELDSGGRPVGDAGVADLLALPQSAGLKRLSFAGCGITGNGAQQLAEKGSLPRLRWLDLSGNRIGAESAARLIGQDGLPELEFLQLCNCELPMGELAAALRTQEPRSPPLYLALNGNRFREGEFRRICECPALRGLNGLGLGNPGLEAAEAEWLAACPHLGSLRRLDFSGDYVDLGAQGVASLLAAPWLRQLGAPSIEWP